MMNPFVYGEQVGGENFCNREHEIKELTSEINSGQNIMIYSPRRFGKTSLIGEVLEKAKSKGILTVYIDLFPVISEKDFVSISLESISALLSRNSRNIFKKVRSFFKRLSPSLYVTVAEDGTPSVGINFSKTETLPAVEDIFNGLYNFTKEKNKKTVVVFDEFQQIGELEDTRIEKVLRGIIQNQREISYVFMGSKKHLIYDMFNNPARPFFKSTAHFPIKKIHRDIFSGFVRNKFLGANREISLETSMYIVDKAEAHPYYTQMLAHTVWEITGDSEKIENHQVDAAVKKILGREAAAFTNLWDNLTLKQKRLLLALALKKENEKVFSIQFLDTHGLGSSSTVQRGIKSLMAKGIIDREEETIEINDIFLKTWLVRRMRGRVNGSGT
jgi:AAA+ ATPase superfamily predicted ATPase